MENKKIIMRVYAIIVQNKKLCMVSRPLGTNLMLPGGDADPSLTQDQALSKILLAELGAGCDRTLFYKKYEQKEVFGDTTISFYVHMINKLNGTMKPKPGAKLLWLDKKELMSGKYKLPMIFEQHILQDIINSNLI